MPAFAAAASSSLRLASPFVDFPSDSALLSWYPQVRTDVSDFLLSEAGFAKRHWPKLIKRAYPELRNDSLEDMLVKLVVRAYLIRHNLLITRPVRLHDFIEYCAGKGNLTLQCLKARLYGLCFDKDYSSDHNMMTGVGLRCMLDAMAECQLHAGVWFGTKCSPFVGLCRNNHKRAASNGFWGLRKKPFVRAGNLQMVVTSLMFAVGHWSGVHPVLEQPVSSVMPKCEPLCSVLAMMNARKHIVWHGAFNGESPKPLQLWSSQDLSALQRGRPKVRLAQLCVVKGKRYSGNSKALRRSQAYSREFGKAVAEIFKSWKISSRSLQ